MTESIGRIILDTNVWLDALLPERLGRQEAKRLVEKSFERDVRLMYPSHAASDIFYLSCVYIKRYLGSRFPGQPEAVAGAARTTAWENVNFIRENAFAVEQGQGDMWLAAKLEHLHPDLGDNLVLAAALRARARYLVTSNQALLEHAPLAGVAAVTPGDMLKVLDAVG